MTTAVQLNADLFTDLLDEVIGQLNLYRDYDTIRLACTLSVVCRYAHLRIQPIVMLYVDIVSRRHLESFMALRAAGSLAHLRSVTLRIKPPKTTFHSFITLLAHKSPNIERFILQNHDHDIYQVIEIPIIPIHFTYRFHRLTELCFISSFRWQVISPIDRPHGWLRVDRPQRMALFGHLPSMVLHTRQWISHLVIAVRVDTDDLANLAILAPELSRIRRIRLLPLGPPVPLRSPHYPIAPSVRDRQRAQLLSSFPEPVVVDLLRPSIEPNEVVAWFAAHVQDGSIWTIKGTDLRL